MPDTTLTQENSIDVFVERLMAEKGDAGGADQSKLKAELQERVVEKTEEAMLKALPDEKLIELERKLDEGMSDDDLGKFFLNAGVDYQPAVQQAMQELKTEFLGEAA